MAPGLSMQLLQPADLPPVEIIALFSLHDRKCKRQKIFVNEAPHFHPSADLHIFNSVLETIDWTLGYASSASNDARNPRNPSYKFEQNRGIFWIVCNASDAKV